MCRIDSIELYRVALPLNNPWKTGYGCDEVIETVITSMTSGDLRGWGESTPLGMPHCSPEYTAGAYRVARDFLAPAIIGQTLGSADELLRRFSGVKENPFAKAGLELAWWDLEAKRRSQIIYSRQPPFQPFCSAQNGLPPSSRAPL